MNMNMRNLRSPRAKTCAIHKIISKSLPILLSKNNLAAHRQVYRVNQPFIGETAGQPYNNVYVQCWCFISELFSATWSGSFASPDHRFHVASDLRISSKPSPWTWYSSQGNDIHASFYKWYQQTEWSSCIHCSMFARNRKYTTYWLLKLLLLSCKLKRSKLVPAGGFCSFNSTWNIFLYTY